MKLRALISDVHANLEALEAVLADIEKEGAAEIYFLGDLVGYGPDPEKCTDLIIEKCAAGVKGNHDFALIHGPYGFNYIAAEAIRCQRETMLPKCMVMCPDKKARWNYLDNLPFDRREEGVLYVHGSPLDPIADYVFCKKSGVMWDTGKLVEVFEQVEKLMFCGHSHHPCIIYEDMSCFLPPEIDYVADLDRTGKIIVNIGSVGQPRDHDNRACYVLWDMEKNEIRWRRVVYDFETTARKIEGIGCIDNRCGERLKIGR